MINVIQIGVGALGKQVLQYLADRDGINVVGLVDLNPDVVGKAIGEIADTNSSGVTVQSSLDDAIKNASAKPEVAVLTTVSSIEKLVSQVEDAAKADSVVADTSTNWISWPCGRIGEGDCRFRSRRDAGEDRPVSRSTGYRR